MAILYTTGCTKCKILKQKLDEKNITYEICSDVDVMKSKGMMSVPVLEVDGELLNFSTAIQWVQK